MFIFYILSWTALRLPGYSPVIKTLFLRMEISIRPDVLFST